MSDINTAIIERLERVVDSLQENSVKMGQLLAVHNEKLDNKIRSIKSCLRRLIGHSDLNRDTDQIKKGCERDIRLIDDRLRQMEKEDVVYFWCSYCCIFPRVCTRTINPKRVDERR